MRPSHAKHSIPQLSKGSINNEVSDSLRGLADKSVHSG